MADKAKRIEFEYEGRTYTLEYDRKTVERMENNGFVIQDVLDKQLTKVPELFHGAFQMHHRGISRAFTDEILYSMKDVVGLTTKLVEMYAEPVNTLLSDEIETKNTTWGASW